MCKFTVVPKNLNFDKNEGQPSTLLAIEKIAIFPRGVVCNLVQNYDQLLSLSQQWGVKLTDLFLIHYTNILIQTLDTN